MVEAIPRDGIKCGFDSRPSDQQFLNAIKPTRFLLVEVGSELRY